MRLRRTLIAVSGAALLFLPPAAVAAAHSYVVVMEKMKFGPLPAGLRKGDSIMWVNRDFLRHTATAADHSFDVDLQPGKAGKTVLGKSGSIPFACRFHPGMSGVLQVK